MYSLSLQWADYDEAADTAAKSGWPAIGWTARGGGHVLPENVARDLPRAVAAARKAGLTVPIIDTPLRDAQTPYVEQYLDTMSKLGLRYYRRLPLGHGLAGKVTWIDLVETRIEALANSTKSTGRRLSPVRGRRWKHLVAAGWTSG